MKIMMTKFDIEILEYYTVAQLLQTKANLNNVLIIYRNLKDVHMDNRDIDKAISDEKNILIICENIDNVEAVLSVKESEAIIYTSFGQYSLN